jgi:hypothetical protein
VLLHGLRIAVAAARTIRAGFALIQAKEDVVLVERIHGLSWKYRGNMAERFAQKADGVRRQPHGACLAQRLGFELGPGFKLGREAKATANEGG